MLWKDSNTEVENSGMNPYAPISQLQQLAEEPTGHI